MTSQKKALVLFSGGQDSATCLAWALTHYAHVETLGFHYGQRHQIEMEARPTVLAGMRSISTDWAARLGEDHVINMPLIADISETALTRKAEIQLMGNGLPNTFVPGRNIMFLTVAAMVAYRRGIDVMVGGMCETDFSGYPDCRHNSLQALEQALNLGMAADFSLETPLMWLDKAQTWALAETLGGAPLVDLILQETHTCYLGEQTRHAWGMGCATCPACELRAKGYQEYVK